ncbi:MAG: hypothetical protein A3F17_03490 [Gammaproteobacteria bacterium RIFCSPHIGHO2_12_FULL_41_15]|nr:MAG: hypothetical protein A3F17_03490 [Gammaproteobacteria bacterium RIFCSPHIGHO2_12_FULL_41_15]
MKIENWSDVDRKAPQYYEEIIKLCEKQGDLPKNLVFIVVDHCLFTFQSHAESLMKMGGIAGVILKSSTHVATSIEYAQTHCKVLQVSKENLKERGRAIKLILDNTTEEQKLVLLDHGGYFAPKLGEIIDHPELAKRILGIVEVTENGYQKYQATMRALQKPFPLLSIARTEIKELEDAQVGTSIFDASNTILYNIHASLSSTRTICVIGYGKIGRSIANSCREHRIIDIIVLEIDSLRAQAAHKHGHKVYDASSPKEREFALQQAEMIFSSTGKRALTALDVNILRNAQKTQKNRVLYIASCTSPDDEFDPSFFSELEAQSVNSKEERDEYLQTYKLSPYRLFNGGDIFILNGGKAVNFAVGGTPGYEICQVWAAVLFCTAKIASGSIESKNFIQELTRSEQNEISKVTCSVFLSEKNVENTHRRSHRRSLSLGDFHQGLFEARKGKLIFHENEEIGCRQKTLHS